MKSNAAKLVCSTCNGEGKLYYDSGRYTSRCMQCKGTGKVNPPKCPECQGEGYNGGTCQLCWGLGVPP